MREKDIIYENDGFWIGLDKNIYVVYRPSPSFTHSISDSGYEELSLAKARCDYLARRSTL
jgi:hypothetical protein